MAHTCQLHTCSQLHTFMSCSPMYILLNVLSRPQLNFMHTRAWPQRGLHSSPGVVPRPGGGPAARSLAAAARARRPEGFARPGGGAPGAGGASTPAAVTAARVAARV